MKTKMTIQVEFKIETSWRSIFKAKMLGSKAIDKLVEAMAENIRNQVKDENENNT